MGFYPNAQYHIPIFNPEKKYLIPGIEDGVNK